MLRKLLSLAQGRWSQERSVKRLSVSDPALHDLELWSGKVLKGARILFESAVDFDETSRSWKEMLRIWVRVEMHGHLQAQDTISPSDSFSCYAGHHSES